MLRNVYWSRMRAPIDDARLRLPVIQVWSIMVSARKGLLAVLALAACPGLALAQDVAQQPAPGQRAPDRFVIEAIDVLGVTILPPAAIEKIIYDYTGPDRTAADVEAARKAIQDAYAARGYEAVVVEIPEQPTELFAQGVVQIKVSEAPVGRIRVTESRYHALSTVREQMPSVKEGQPLDLRALQTDLDDANRFPDRQVTPSFKPGIVPGTVDVDLRVQDTLPVHANLELNNDNSPSTTDLRLSGGVRYTNLWQAGHSIGANFVIAPRSTKESTVVSGSYTAPLIGTPWTLLLYGYWSNSDVAALGGSNVLGNGYQVGVRAIYRLPSKSLFQSISFGPDFKDFKQNIFVAGQLAGEAPIRYIPVVAEYSLSGGGEHSQFDATIGVTAGLRAIKKIRCVEVAPNAPCVPVDQFNNREIDSNENFVHLNASANYSIATKSDFVAALRWTGQFADSHLVTNEQFAAGGLSSVRGYYQSEAVGDNGSTLSLELRSPSAATWFGSFVDELRVFAFVDGGYAHVLRALPEQQDNFTLVSVGGGARIRLLNYFSGEVMAGVPLRDGPVSSAGDPRVIFVVKGEF